MRIGDTGLVTSGYVWELQGLAVYNLSVESRTASAAAVVEESGLSIIHFNVGTYSNKYFSQKKLNILFTMAFAFRQAMVLVPPE